MCVVAAGGACGALFSLSSRVCCRVQGGWLPLHCAAANSESEAVVKAVLDAYPDAAKEKCDVRCGRGRRVLCLLLSSPHTCAPCPLPRPFSPLCRMGSCQRTSRGRTLSRRSSRCKGKMGMVC